MLGICRRVEGRRDRYKNPVVTYAPAIEWPVYSIAPRSSDEPDEAGRDAVITGITVHAPVDGPHPGPLDRVKHAGTTWQVTGDVGTWDGNPHVVVTSQRGIVVNLDRTEG